MIRSWLGAVAVLITGALLGSFLGKFVSLCFPQGRLHDLFATDIAAGLHPTQLDLRIVDVTFGCLFHFNVTSVLGIIAAALLFKTLSR